MAFIHCEHLAKNFGIRHLTLALSSDNWEDNMDFGFKSKYGWLTAKFGKYPNGRVGIQLLQDGFPFARMSVNLPDVELQEREFHLDMQQCLPIINDIMDCGHFEDMNREDQSGFKTFSVYKIKDHVPIDVVQ